MWNESSSENELVGQSSFFKQTDGPDSTKPQEGHEVLLASNQNPTLLNKFFILEVYSVALVILSVFNIVYNVLLNFKIVSTPKSTQIMNACPGQIPMLSLLDTVISVSVAFYFAQINLYIRNVE